MTRALASAAVTLWLAGSSVATALLRRFADGLNDRRGHRCPHRLDAEICTHGSLQASFESNPNPSRIRNYTEHLSIWC